MPKSVKVKEIGKEAARIINQNLSEQDRKILELELAVEKLGKQFKKKGGYSEIEVFLKTLIKKHKTGSLDTDAMARVFGAKGQQGLRELFYPMIRGGKKMYEGLLVSYASSAFKRDIKGLKDIGLIKKTGAEKLRESKGRVITKNQFKKMGITEKVFAKLTDKQQDKLYNTTFFKNVELRQAVKDMNYEQSIKRKFGLDDAGLKKAQKYKTISGLRKYLTNSLNALEKKKEEERLAKEQERKAKEQARLLKQQEMLEKQQKREKAKRAKAKSFETLHTEVKREHIFETLKTEYGMDDPEELKRFNRMGIKQRKAYLKDKYKEKLEKEKKEELKNTKGLNTALAEMSKKLKSIRSLTAVGIASYLGSKIFGSIKETHQQNVADYRAWGKAGLGFETGRMERTGIRGSGADEGEYMSNLTAFRHWKDLLNTPEGVANYTNNARFFMGATEAGLRLNPMSLERLRSLNPVEAYHELLTSIYNEMKVRPNQIGAIMSGATNAGLGSMAEMAVRYHRAGKNLPEEIGRMRRIADTPHDMDKIVLEYTQATQELSQRIDNLTTSLKAFGMSIASWGLNKAGSIVKGIFGGSKPEAAYAFGDIYRKTGDFNKAVRESNWVNDNILGNTFSRFMGDESAFARMFNGLNEYEKMKFLEKFKNEPMIQKMITGENQNLHKLLPKPIKDARNNMHVRDSNWVVENHNNYTPEQYKTFREQNIAEANMEIQRNIANPIHTEQTEILKQLDSINTNTGIAARNSIAK